MKNLEIFGPVGFQEGFRGACVTSIDDADFFGTNEAYTTQHKSPTKTANVDGGDGEATPSQPYQSAYDRSARFWQEKVELSTDPKFMGNNGLHPNFAPENQGSGTVSVDSSSRVKNRWIGR